MVTIDELNAIELSRPFNLWEKRQIYINGPTLANNVIGTNEVLHNNPTNGMIDLMIKGLMEQKWNEDTISCFNAMLFTLQNAKNSTLWATWILDSIQLPNGHLFGSQYHLGNYDQCLNAPWRSAGHGVPTKYCLSDIKLSRSSKIADIHSDPYNSVKTYVETRTKLHLRDFSKMTFGTCVPKACDIDGVSNIIRVLLNLSQLGSVAEDAAITVESCDDPDTPTKYGIGSYAFLFTILVLFMTAILSTIYFQNIVYKKDNDATHLSFVQEIFRAFCMERNTKELTATKENEIYSMNWIRVFTSLLAISTHLTIFANPYAYYTGINYEKLFASTGMVIEHVDIFLNTIFAFSGILLIRNIMGKNTNPYKLIWKRYIRFIGLMAVLIFYIITWSIHTGDGPLWMKFSKPEQENCVQNGWLIFLMVNNYVNTENLCLLPSWHVSCDYLLTVFGIFLFVIYRKNNRLGTILFVAAFIASFLYPGIVTYSNKMSATAFFGIDSLVDLRKNIVFLKNYAQSHARAAPFFVGMATGYLLVLYKPSDYRNVIPKKWSLAGFSLACYAKYYALTLADHYFKEYNRLEVAIYASTNGVIWAIASCIIILVSEYGSLPMLNNFFKWSPLVPLSRLTYGVNMIHVLFLQRILHSTRNLYTNALIEVFVNGFGYAVASFLVSYFLWLTVEAPLVNITNLIFDPKTPKRHTQMNGIKKKEVKSKDL